MNLSAGMMEKISFAEANLGDSLISTQTRAFEFKQFGKLFITSNNLRWV